MKRLESQLSVKKERARNVQARDRRHAKKDLESALIQTEEMIREK